MLKKSLVAIAVLAIALPAFAGKIKVHNPWPTQLVPQEVSKIDVIMDVGYWIHIKDQKPIKISQNGDYYTYRGCRKSDFLSNFDALVSAKFSKEPGVKGNYKGTFNGESELLVNPGKTVVEMCVNATDVNIDDFPGGTDKYKVATMRVMVLPANP